MKSKKMLAMLLACVMLFGMMQTVALATAEMIDTQESLVWVGTNNISLVVDESAISNSAPAALPSIEGGDLLPPVPQMKSVEYLQVPGSYKLVYD